MVYLDNAATSWPKPESVYAAADKALRYLSGNPGRSGHKLSLAAGRVIEEARFSISRLFNIPDPKSVIFTMNATEALNLAIKGIAEPGDHVITGSMEHNSVARPLEALSQVGVEVTKVKTSPVTGIDIGDISASIRDNTKLVVLSHVSNVTGTVNPVSEIGEICRQRNILFLVDAAQSAGTIPIDVRKMKIDMLAFPGHKGLLGPQGTGGLYIRKGIVLKPLKEGGTGTHSEMLIQPPESPERYESGTLNTCGIAGLAAGVRFILDNCVEKIQEKESELACKLIEGIRGIPGAIVYGPSEKKPRSGVVSFNLESMDASEAAVILDSAFDIAVRSGLHCSPDAHKTLGTLEKGGTVRISIGYYNTEEDIDYCIKALHSISGEGG